MGPTRRDVFGRSVGATLLTPMRLTDTAIGGDLAIRPSIHGTGESASQKDPCIRCDDLDNR